MRISIYWYFIKRMIHNPPRLGSIENYAKYRLGIILKQKTLINTPLSVVIFVNTKCNLNCKFCYFKKERNIKGSNKFDLTLEQTKKILDNKLIINECSPCYLLGIDNKLVDGEANTS